MRLPSMDKPEPAKCDLSVLLYAASAGFILGYVFRMLAS